MCYKGIILGTVRLDVRETAVSTKEIVGRILGLWDDYVRGTWLGWILADLINDRRPILKARKHPEE